MSVKSTSPKRVLILGSGFGGLYTALHLEKKLARNSDVEITLVNRENFFLFTPMLHEVAAGDLDLTHIVNPVRKLLRRAHFFNGEIRSLDLAARCVFVTHGDDNHDHKLVECCRATVRRSRESSLYKHTQPSRQRSLRARPRREQHFVAA